MSNRERSELIKLAAEMVHGVGMPPEYVSDHAWCKTTCAKERDRVVRDAQKAHDQCKDWAMRIKAIADRLALTQGDDRG